MTSAREKLEITPKLIDLGDEIIAVGHIARASCVSGHPFRLAGAGVVALALAAIAYEMALGKGLGAIKSGGSTPIWMALVAAGLGIFATVYQRRGLTIATSDGRTILLSGARDAFLREVVARIGEAIVAAPGDRLHYVVDLKAGTVRPVMTATGGSSDAADMHGSFALPQHQHPAAAATPVQPHDPVPSAVAAAGWGGAAPVNGQPAHLPPARDPIVISGRQAEPHWASAQWPAAPATGESFSHGGPHLNGRPVAAPQAQAAPPSRRELEALIALVMRANIQHKAALLDLLNVVDDHLKGGQTDGVDARAHWESFSGYVEQYLSDVDGLLPMTRRVGRSLPLH